MSIRTSFRAVTLTASIGLVAVIAGCAVAPAGTEDGTEGAGNAVKGEGTTASAESVKATGESVKGKVSSELSLSGITIPPIYLPPALWTETMYGTAAECTNPNVSIPTTAMVNAGCTYGAMFEAVLGDSEEDYYTVWACPAANITTAMVPASGFGLYPTARSETASITSFQEVGLGCFGEPVNGEVLVVDLAIFERSHIKGGCTAACN